MYDVVIRNARVIDGTGNPWFIGSVGIKDELIASIWRSPTLEVEAAEIIEAEGLVLSPGVIDVHGHSDFTILDNPGADNLVSQGITTQGIGQCGFSTYAFSGENAEAVRDLVRAISPDAFGEDLPGWRTLEHWRRVVEETGTAINLVPYVGHNVLRCSAMGSDGDRALEPTPGQSTRMEELLREGMEQGAFGISTGLRYPFGRNADTEEVARLCAVVQEYGGVHISHMRSEEEYLIPSVDELIQISESTGVRGCATHHKAMFVENWGTPVTTLRMLEEARERGVDVLCDLYPWGFAREVNLGRHFVAFTGDAGPGESQVEILLEQLGDEGSWRRIKERLVDEAARAKEVNQRRKEFLWKKGVYAPDLWDASFFDCVVHSPSNPKLVGLNFSQVARKLKLEDHWDAMRRVYLEDRGATLVAAGPIGEDDLQRILAHPLSMVGTDAEAQDIPPELDDPMANAHPRGWGTYPRVLGEYVREKRVLSLEEAIRKMTSLPAGFLGLDDRGTIKPGLNADLLLFDPESIDSLATHAKPCEKPRGIHSVFVNGRVAVRRGESRATRSGRVLRR